MATGGAVDDIDGDVADPGVESPSGTPPPPAVLNDVPSGVRRAAAGSALQAALMAPGQSGVGQVRSGAPASSAGPAAPVAPEKAPPGEPDYNPGLATHRAQVAAAIEREGQPVQRGNGRTAWHIAGTVIVAPFEAAFLRPAGMIEHTASALFGWTMGVIERGNVLEKILAVLLLVFISLPFLFVGKVLRVVADVVSLPFVLLQKACDAIGAATVREEPASRAQANFARMPASAWPVLPENEEAVQRAREYVAGGERREYDVIIVPGYARRDRAEPMSASMRWRLDQAARDWQSGRAPFILVTGGNVWPDGTPYNEAMEMRRYLMEAHKIPAEAILAEPSARHTTTNLRNAGRLMRQLGLTRGLVVSSDAPIVGQSYYMQNADSIFGGLQARSLFETGVYLGRLSGVDASHTVYEPSSDVDLVQLRNGQLVEPRDP